MENRKMFMISFGASMLLFASLAIAGDGKYHGKEHHGTGFPVQHSSYFTLGGTLFNAEELNSGLSANGYHGVKDYAVQAGGGFSWKAGRLISGAELFGNLWRKEELAAAYTRLYGIESRLHIGFNVLPEGPAILYPRFGFGLGGTGLRLGREQVAFTDVLASPINEVKLWQRTFVLEPGLGFDYHFKSRMKPGKTVAVGIRAGYAFDVTDDNDWRSDGVGITSGPDFASSGPFVRLVIGKSYVKKMSRCPEKCPHKGEV